MKKQNEKNYFEGFEEKVKSMTAKEIVLSMVDGMINPVMTVDIDTYGFATEDGVCYGCSATNMICKVANVKPIEVLKVNGSSAISHGLSHHGEFLDSFEYAINELRSGSFSGYNQIAREFGFAQIELEDDYVIGFDQYNFDDPEQHKIWFDLSEKL